MSDNPASFTRKYQKNENLRCVEGDLKRSPHALRAHCRYQLFRLNNLNDLGDESFPIISLLLAGATLLNHLLLFPSNRISPIKHRWDFTEMDLLSLVAVATEEEHIYFVSR